MLSEEKDLRHVYQQWSLPEALLYFQLIEQALKEIILLHHKLIQIRLDGFSTYNYSENSINDAAMGRLIDLFKVFCEDSEFIKLLRSVKTDRDRIAHKGYLEIHPSHTGDYLITKEISKVKNSVNKASVVLSRLKTINSESQSKLDSVNNV